MFETFFNDSLRGASSSGEGNRRVGSAVLICHARRMGERSGYADRFDYRVDIHRRRNRVTAEFEGRLIASTTNPLLVDEQDHGLVFYFPRSDLLIELRADPTRTSYCPYKGDATYWHFDGDGDGEALCWSYDDPYEQVAELRDHVGFYQDAIAVRLWQADPAVVGYPPRNGA
jgi:uncharacterized protein (DUF427 family)